MQTFPSTSVNPHAPRHKPLRTLNGLCDLYDLNYALLLELMPALANRERYSEWLAGNVTHLSLPTTAGADEPLHARVVECSPYTTTIKLSYHFFDESAAEGERWVPDPDLEVRVYHDAQQAETLHCGRNTHCDILRQFRGAASSGMERRWQVNQLLHKWLEYLLHHGQRFPVLA